MSRRWERELRSLREIPAPTERIRSRLAAGPSRPDSAGAPPGRERLAAGIVALVVFVAAGAFAWRAFDETGEDDVGSTPGMSTYTDPLGWRIDYPADWYVVPIDTGDAKVQERGAQFSNIAMPVPSWVPDMPLQPNGADLPGYGVAFIVSHRFGGPFQEPTEIPELPVSSEGFLVGSAPAGSSSIETLSFRIGDEPFRVAVKLGPEVSPDELSVVDEMVASIRSAPAGTSPGPVATPTATEYATPFFPYREGWHTRDFGPVDRGNGAVAWASTVPFDPADRVERAPAIPPASIAQLPPDGVIVTVLATPWFFDPELGPYPPVADRPSDLGQAILRGPEAEEPPGDYSILEIEPGYFLVRVYFGVANPSAQLVAHAQQELDSLEIPPVCPMPAERGFGATLSTAAGAPGDAITIYGPMPFQHEDGSFDHSGDSRMIAWWNASPDDAALLSSFSRVEPSPATTGPLLRLGEAGRGACSFSIGFTVPDVPPGDYPIVVLQEGGGGGSTMEAALTFTVR